MPWNLDYNEWPGPYDQSNAVEFKMYSASMADFTKAISAVVDSITLTINSGVKSHGPRPEQTYDHRGRRRY